jgi:hypothetical protein
MVDGSQTAGYVMTSDAEGVASWQDVNTLVDTLGFSADSDRDTRIQTEKYANEDKIRFDLNGYETFRMEQNKLFVNFNGVGDGSELDLVGVLGTSSIRYHYAVSDGHDLIFNVAGTDALSLGDDGSVTVHDSYTLPSSDGTSGQVL